MKNDYRFRQFLHLDMGPYYAILLAMVVCKSFISRQDLSGLPFQRICL